MRRTAGGGPTRSSSDFASHSRCTYRPIAPPPAMPSAVQKLRFSPTRCLCTYRVSDIPPEVASLFLVRPIFPGLSVKADHRVYFQRFNRYDVLM